MKGDGTRVDQILSPNELAELIRDVTGPPLPRKALAARRRRFGMGSQRPIPTARDLRAEETDRGA